MTPIEHVKLRLKDFAPAISDSPILVLGVPIEVRQFPVPNLLLYLLHGLCEFSMGYRGEKTHWIVPFSYKGVNYAIAHEKFGLRLYEQSGAETKPAEVLGKLQKSLELAERHILNELATSQIANGNVTIANNFNKLGAQYDYFRQRAIAAYVPDKDFQDRKDASFDLTDILNCQFGASREGGFNALAMIDAYFSRLEHFLVLSLPFAGYARETDNLAEFVGLLWSQKFRRILDSSKLAVNQHYEALVGVKEKFRNTFAHGGFEKNGQSFFFHLNKFGAIPASMSGVRDSVHFNFFPIDKEGFESICGIFDEFDAYLSSTATPNAWKLAESGLDLSFDSENLFELLNAAENTEDFDAWITKQSSLNDMYINADY